MSVYGKRARVPLGWCGECHARRREPAGSAGRELSAV